MSERTATIKRATRETRIEMKLEVDGTGKSSVSTGIAFFDHMLTLFAKHAVVNLKVKCKGDLEVDAHHTVEDCGIALGQAFREALGDKAGIRRYGWNEGKKVEGRSKKGEREANAQIGKSALLGADALEGADWKSALQGEAYVPMDECLARCVIDFSGRPYLVWRGLDELAYKKLTSEEKGQDMSSAFRFGLAREFFQGFANEARCNLHLELLYGDEPHHVVEALFKAFAKATDFACQHDPRIAGQIPSTKGKL
jgi:imidazoleglycerol-phosphate dehydratase